MDSDIAAKCFSALGHPRRLDVLRLLIKHAPDGINAGTISGHFKQPPSTMSAHLKLLTGADLVTSNRNGREILFAPNMERVRDLILFLLVDCCGTPSGNAEPLLTALLPSSSESEP